MGEVRRLSYVELCSCGSTIIGYEAGDPCPDCGEVILDATE